ncbi:uncharacterized protein BJ212DRAFT_1320596, partial [Suillus subaureus]
IHLAITVLIISTQFQLFNMIEEGESKQSKAQWSEEEVDGLLSYLQLQVSKIAGVTFRDETFHEAAKSIAHLSKQGSPKDMAQCKRKWKALKQIHLAIERYCNRSRFY